MAGNAGEWDQRARPEKWLQPGERIVWRGAPDASVIFAPQDLYLIPFSLLWTGFAIFWEHGVAKEGWSFGVIWGVPFILLGVYIVIGRFPVKVWNRLHIWYAVTDLRAVQIDKRGDRIQSAGRPAPVEIRRRRDGRHGTVIFHGDHDDRPRRWASSQWSFLRGTGWPGAGRFPELAFVDVEGIDELVSSLRRTGFVLDEKGKTSPVREPGHARDDQRAFRVPGHFGFIRGWVRSRLLRQPWSMWSPLAPLEVANRLSQNLSPLREFSFGFRLADPYQGTINGWNVRLMKVGAMQRNSWRLVFEGTVFQDGTGTRLAGTLGPISFVPVFSAVWVGGVSLFFIGGFVGFVTDLVSGHGATLAPFALIPLAMLAMFVGMTEVGTKSARQEWVSMERWLRTLLEVPPAARAS